MSEPTDRATDLSDEGYLEWVKESDGIITYPRDAWNECRRRAEAMLEQERRKAFEAGWRSCDDEVNCMSMVEGIAEAYREFQQEITK
jgi:hypothetical protein